MPLGLQPQAKLQAWACLSPNKQREDRAMPFLKVAGVQPTPPRPRQDSGASRDAASRQRNKVLSLIPFSTWQ
jgi:hypothetical protein